MHSEISAWKSSVNYTDPSKPLFWIAKMSSAVRHKTMVKGKNSVHNLTSNSYQKNYFIETSKYCTGKT